MATKKRGPKRAEPKTHRKRPEAPVHEAAPPKNGNALRGAGAGAPRPGRASTEEHAPPPRELPAAGDHRFPIVGIGASAGGLEALEQFLGHTPERSGMAFVIIQHLDPTHKGAMVELLQRASPLPVVEAQDRQRVEPDHVYVIPPNKDMSILHGHLQLLPQASPRGLNLPIDYFFRSLAEDQREASIGVVLSGMGSDGSLGLRAIKETAGATFVQSLASAKFEGMPRSVIDAGLADVVAPAEELPARIAAFHRHAPHLTRPETVTDERHQSALEKIFIVLRSQSGNDFSLYKRSTVQRRIERRMGLHQLDDIGSYVRYLRENPREAELLCKELLIGVTSFFRDPESWKALRAQVLPELLQTRAAGGILRAWVPACSTGEEAYSLAILLHEAADDLRASRNFTFQIFATDLDKEAIERARQGSYPANIAADVSPERLRKYFLKDENGYRIRKDIRETVVFAPQNLITDPPFTKLDILSCRNLLIYLSAELQRRLIPLFHYALNAGGVLFLGSAETVGGFVALFGSLDMKARLYRRLDTNVGLPVVEFPSSFVAREGIDRERRREPPDPAKSPPATLQAVTDHVIVQRFAPPVVLTNIKGDILYISGRTGKFLEPALGKATLNVFAMAREGLRAELPSAFAAALKQDRPVGVRGVKIRTNGSTALVDLTVQKLTEPKELNGTMVIVFAESPSTVSDTASSRKPPRLPVNKRIAGLEQELGHAREEAQMTREEMQTSQEELKSTNEELQSTNEELQSTNEELTTSKEEMQSMNEELQTVNRELQSKVDDLARSNNDMRNLLNSTDVATLFLDSDLLVRRFTTQTTKIIKLIPSDAGRPITDISTDLDYPELADDAREVLRTLIFREKQIPARDGHWYSVRIMPYRTVENVIDGVVITFTDSTAAKTLEATLHEQTSQARQMTDSLPSLVWGCGPDGACDYLSSQWTAYTGVAESAQLGYRWLAQVHEDDRERIREKWKAAIAASTPLDTEFRLRAKEGTFRWFKTRSVPIRDEQGHIVKWYGTTTDVDDLKRASEARQQGADALAAVLHTIAEPIVLLDEGLRVTQVSGAAERTLGRKPEQLLQRTLFELFPEVVGTPLEAKIRQRSPASFAASHLDGTPRDGSLDVRVEPLPGGFSVLLKPAGPSPEERSSNGGDHGGVEAQGTDA